MTNDLSTERKALLERIWIAEAKAFAELLENTPAGELPAAVLNTARQFLGDNGVRLDTLKDDKGGMSAETLAEIAAAIEDEPLPEPDV